MALESALTFHGSSSGTSELFFQAPCSSVDVDVEEDLKAPHYWRQEPKNYPPWFPALECRIFIPSSHDLIEAPTPGFIETVVDQTTLDSRGLSVDNGTPDATHRKTAQEAYVHRNTPPNRGSHGSWIAKQATLDSYPPDYIGDKLRFQPQPLIDNLAHGLLCGWSPLKPKVNPKTKEPSKTAILDALKQSQSRGVYYDTAVWLHLNSRRHHP